MQFISSDTSVWIDFSTIGFLQALFLLNDQLTYLMCGDTIDDELLYPPSLREDLLKYGLQRTDLTNAESYMKVLNRGNTVAESAEKPAESAEKPAESAEKPTESANYPADMNGFNRPYLTMKIQLDIGQMGRGSIDLGYGSLRQRQKYLG